MLNNVIYQPKFKADLPEAFADYCRNSYVLGIPLTLKANWCINLA